MSLDSKVLVSIWSNQQNNPGDLQNLGQGCVAIDMCRHQLKLAIFRLEKIEEQLEENMT